MIAFEKESGPVFGFGIWTYARIVFSDDPLPQTAIRIPWFGVDRRFHGATNGQGHSCAGMLYATLEADARDAPHSHEDMLIELFCDERNVRGLAFWRSRGFRDIGTAEGSTRFRRLIR